MKGLFCLVMGLILMLVAGCSQSATGDAKTAADYVKFQGYEITARKGETEHYILEKSKLYGGLEARPFQQAWGVQTVEPDGYFGKEILVYGFTVKNHPLEKIYKQSDGTNVYIMLSDGQIIGGYSFPNADVLGAFSSLDGETLEEVTGLSFQQWRQKWKERYGPDEPDSINPLTQYDLTRQFVETRGYKILVNSGANHDLKLPGSFDEIKNGVQIGALLKEKNELSKQVGLDFSNYLGKSVTLVTYGVKTRITFSQTQIW